MIRAELVKQTRRARGWLTLSAITGVVILLTVAIAVYRPSDAERVGNWLSVTPASSGLAMPLIALNGMSSFLLPLAVAVFAGEAIAGEAAWGSLRYQLARPVSRLRFLGSKAAVAAMFSVGAVVMASAAALLAGVVAFGWHGLHVLDLEHTTPFHVATAAFSPADAALRTVAATAVVAGSLASTFTFSLLLSTLTDHPFSAVAGGVGLGLFSRALDNVPGLSSLGPWLPATNSGATAWTALFTDPVQTSALAHLLVVQGAYSTCFVVAALWCFRRSDIHA